MRQFGQSYGNLIQGDITVSSRAPTINFLDSTTGQAAWAIKVDDSDLFLKKNGTTLLQYDSSESKFVITGDLELTGTLDPSIVTFTTKPTFNLGLNLNPNATAGTVAGDLRADSLDQNRIKYFNGIKELPVNTFVSIKEFGAVGDGSNDDTAEIQAAVDYVEDEGGGRVYAPAGSYKITSSIILPANVIFFGDGYSTEFVGPGDHLKDGEEQYPFFDIVDCSNVAIRDININGGGSWTSTPFPNYWEAGNSVGFTNRDIGVRIKRTTGNLSNFEISNCYFTGIAFPIYRLGSGTVSNVCFKDNTCINIGEGCRFLSMDNVLISGNIVIGVEGNTTDGGVTDIAESKFADGFYIYESVNGVIENNYIEDCRRIGIVFEAAASPTRKCRNWVASNNVCKDMVGHRGGERNAGLWIEGTKAESPMVFIGNTVDGSDEYGIIANECIVSGGSVKGCDLSGIVGGAGPLTISGVEVEDNLIGMNLTSPANTGHIKVLGCSIKSNTQGGLLIYQSKGTHSIKGNTIEDNGTTATTASDGFNYGLKIERHYNDQYLDISNNTFISSANDAATSGQLYAILSTAGGDFTRTQKGIVNNHFMFTGTLAAYPANLAVVPCSYAYDNTAGTVSKYDIAQQAGNHNSKIFQTNDILESGGNVGFTRLVGYATAAPGSGTYRTGDYFQNRDFSSGESLYFVCTSGGTPGTWVNYGGPLITLGTANGLALTAAGVLTMDAAGASTTGSVTSSAQTFGGAKTFNARPRVIIGSTNQVIMPGGLYTWTNSATGNVTTGEDDLYSVALAANFLTVNGDEVVLEIAGTFAANANNKTIKVKFGGTTVFDTTALAFNAGSWFIRTTIVRTGASAQKAITEWSSSNTTLLSTCNYTTAAIDTTAGITFSVTGEGTNTNDIVKEFVRLKFNGYTA